MSYAIDALVLIRLQARASRWVTAKQIAAHFSLVEHVVAASLDSLGRRGLIRVQRNDAGGPVVRAIAYSNSEVTQ